MDPSRLLSIEFPVGRAAFCLQYKIQFRMFQFPYGARTDMQTHELIALISTLGILDFSVVYLPPLLPKSSS